MVRKSSKRNSKTPLSLPWWDLYNKYSEPELGRAANEDLDQDDHAKVKLAGDNSFKEAVPTLENLLKQEFAAKKFALDDPTPILFSTPIGGGDDGLSLYAALAKGKPKNAAAPVTALFHDVSPWKIDYLIARAYIAAASANPAEYIDTLLMSSKHFGTEANDENLYHHLQHVSDGKKMPSHEAHLEHIMEKVRKLKLDDAEGKRVEQAIDKLVTLLHWKRGNTYNYKHTASELQKNLQVNNDKHWLNSGFKTIKQAVKAGNLKFLHMDVDNDEARAKYMKFLKASDVDNQHRAVLALPQASRKFKNTKVLARHYAHFMSTVQTPELHTAKKWVIDAPSRIFQYNEPRLEEVYGELSLEALEDLRLSRKVRVEQSIKKTGSAISILLGDLGIGSSSYTDRTKAVIEYLARRSKELNIENVVLVGSPIAGMPETEKQFRGRFYTKEPFTTVLEQLVETRRLLDTIDTKYRHAINTEDLMGWIYAVTNQKYQEKLEDVKHKGVVESLAGTTTWDKGGSVETKWKDLSTLDKKRIRARLRIESYFEAVPECCEVYDEELGLSEKVVDRLHLQYPNMDLDFQHKRPSQYWSRHTGIGTVRKDSNLAKQRSARTADPTGTRRSILFTGHDMDLRVQPHSPDFMQVAIPAAADIQGHLGLPEEIQRDNWSMLHKKIAVESKLPDPTGTIIEITRDGRIIYEIAMEDMFKYLEPSDKIPERRATIFSTGDAQMGSLANKPVNGKDAAAELLMKYLDFTFFQLPKMNKDKDWSLVWFDGGDCTEGQNYPLAALRNYVNDIAEQNQLYNALCQPFVTQKDRGGKLGLNPLISKFIKMRGNHEINSSDKRQAFNSADAVADFYRGLLLAQHGDMTKVDEMMPFGRRHIIERDGHHEELYNLMAGYAKVLNYPIIGSHFFEPGSPVGSDFTVPMVNWLNRIGEAAKEYAIMLQWHWHNFGLSTHAGKLLVNFPAHTKISDYEYELGLSPQYMGTFVHLSNKTVPRVEVLTNNWLLNYKMQHPDFQTTTPTEYEAHVLRRIQAPVKLFADGNKYLP